jgi:hypothetical protein
MPRMVTTGLRSTNAPKRIVSSLICQFQVMRIVLVIRCFSERTQMIFKRSGFRY